MKKILILGNGFDLNLGFPTSYKHFLESQFFQELITKGNPIAHYLHDRQGIENWVDVELSLAMYIDRVTRSGHSTQTLKEFKSYYNKLTQNFFEYLREIDYEDINGDSEAFEFLISEAIKESSVANVHIYNFNYTPTVKQILKSRGWTESDFKERYTQVHGDIESGIILGIHDASGDTTLHSLAKKANNRNFRTCSLSTDLLGGNEIAVFGYSLGATDEMYFKDAFTHLSTIRSLPIPMDLYYHSDDGLDAITHRMDVLTGGNMTSFQNSVHINRIPLKHSN